MCDNDSFVGRRSKNPFNFQHYDITQFNLSVNGTQIPNLPIEFDYDKQPPISARGYNSLFKGTNMQHFDKSHQISKKFFDEGCFLLCFNLSADQGSGAACSNLLNQGVVRIEARFKKALKNTITCIVYAEYDRVIEIDKNRNIYTF